MRLRDLPTHGSNSMECSTFSLFHFFSVLPLSLLVSPALLGWHEILRVATSAFFLTTPCSFHCCLYRHVVRFIGGEAVGVHHQLLSECAVLCCQVGDGGAIIRRGLIQIGKFHRHIHDIVCDTYADVPPLLGGLMSFAQVCLCLNEMCQEYSPGGFWI